MRRILRTPLPIVITVTHGRKFFETDIVKYALSTWMAPSESTTETGILWHTIFVKDGINKASSKSRVRYGDQCDKLSKIRRWSNLHMSYIIGLTDCEWWVWVWSIYSPMIRNEHVLYCQTWFFFSVNSVRFTYRLKTRRNVIVQIKKTPTALTV